MPTVNGKKFAYTVEGMKKAEVAASKTNPTSPIRADQSVYGPTNAKPKRNPDSNTLLTRRRDTSKRRKAPGPYSIKNKPYSVT